MIKRLLAQNEGKTLEFTENVSSIQNIMRTAVAFANTAGGMLVFGVRDRTKEVVGVKNALDEEERIASIFSDNIRPALVPEIQIVSWRDRELIVVTVPHLVGPFYIRSGGPEKGVYVRLGSTNRRAGPELITAIQRLAINTFFDEQPCTEVNSERLISVQLPSSSPGFPTRSRHLHAARWGFS